MSEPRRGGRGRTVALGLALVALVAVPLALLGRGAWGPPAAPPPVVAAPQPPPAPPAAPRPAVDLKVTGLSGQVERSDASGGWRPLAQGDLLGLGEQVRTGPRSTADLAAGERAHLTIGERTQVAVRELNAVVHRYRLTRGLVTADVQPDGDRQVRIEGASEGDPAAAASAARFHVAAGGLAFAVATETGGVSLSSAGGAVALSAGQSSRVSAGLAPSVPRSIPTAVLLKVAEASRVGPPGRCLPASGQADPSALVTVDGEEVPVGPDGRFPIKAARPERGVVNVRVVLPDGRATDRTFRCQAAPEARIDDLRMRWKNGAP